MMRRRIQAGFTLLELLIAVVIVSMVMTTAFAAVRIGSRSWEAGHERTDSIEEMRSFAEFLRRQMGQSVAASWEDEEGSRIAFSGRQHLVRFIAPAPIDLASVGLLTYSLVIDDQPAGTTLQLEYEVFDPGATGFRESGTANVITFATIFDSVTLDYYGRVDVDNRDTWYSEWPGTAELLPVQVRLRFGADDGGNTWPDLVVALHSRLTP